MILKKKMKKHNSDWPKIPDHQQKILIIGGSVSGKKVII